MFLLGLVAIVFHVGDVFEFDWISVVLLGGLGITVFLPEIRNAPRWIKSFKAGNAEFVLRADLERAKRSVSGTEDSSTEDSDFSDGSSLRTFNFKGYEFKHDRKAGFVFAHAAKYIAHNLCVGLNGRRSPFLSIWKNIVVVVKGAMRPSIGEDLSRWSDRAILDTAIEEEFIDERRTEALDALEDLTTRYTDLGQHFEIPSEFYALYAQYLRLMEEVASDSVSEAARRLRKSN
jgi:hypothetical protein